jgi:hypothetical protein
MNFNCAHQLAVSLALTIAVFVSPGKAQADDNFTWDPSASGNQFVGGSGTWDNGTTVDWLDNGNTPDIAWSNSSPNLALFEGTPGTVTVDGTVSFDAIETINNNPGTWTFGTSVNEGTLFKNSESQFTGGFIFGQESNANVIFNSGITIDAAGDTDRTVFQDNSATATLTFNGNILYTGTNGGAPYRGIQFDSQGGVVTINSSISTGTTGIGGEVVFGEGGGVAGATYYLNGSITNADPNPAITGNKAMEIFAGNVVLGTSQLSTGVLVFVGNNYASTRSILTAGAQTITNTVDDQGNGGDELGGTTADVSSFNGGVNVGGSTETLTAAAGGRVNFTAGINGSVAGGLVKTGAGTVVLNSTNTFDLQDPRNSFVQGNVAADIQQGTLLINGGTDTNGNGALGKNSGQVLVEGGATLGGSGSLLAGQQVVAMTGTSVITAGDPGQASLGIAPSISTLALNGGLAATSGLTLDFKLTGGNYHPSGGTDNDLITTSTLSLGGTVTVNLTTLDTVETMSPYFLMSGTGNWTEADDTIFDINAPTGYTLDTTYGTGGYLFDTGEDQFSVKLVATPEPSTYGLLGLGLLALVAIGRFRKLAA